MREVTIAVAQMKPKLGEHEDNLVKMTETISKIASQQRVDLIVFPELITSGNELGLRFTELAQRVPGPTVNLMAPARQRTWRVYRLWHGDERTRRERAVQFGGAGGARRRIAGRVQQDSSARRRAHGLPRRL